MSDKHTPGPWDAKTRAEWEGGYDFFASPDNAYVFMADVGPEDIPLINAAPDMLRALRALADATPWLASFVTPPSPASPISRSKELRR